MTAETKWPEGWRVWKGDTANAEAADGETCAFVADGSEGPVVFVDGKAPVPEAVMLALFAMHREMDTAKGDAQHDTERAIVATARGRGIIEFKHYHHDNFGAVTRDASAPGRWRITRYGADGLFGHSSHVTEAAALARLADDGYVCAAPGSLDRLLCPAGAAK